MKLYVLFMIWGMTLCAMEYEEKPLFKNQLQLIVNNKDTTSDQFKTYVETRPRLSEVTVTGHQMTAIPELPIFLYGLHNLDLSNGLLESDDCVQQILTFAPNLSRCKLAHNNLSTLSERTLPIHDFLSNLDCSNNQIKKVNFTELHEKLPNLAYLNLSNCPIKKCNTNNSKVSSTITTIDLSGTCLSDCEKKEILKNAHYPCLLNNKEEASFFGFSFGFITMGSAFGFISMFAKHGIGLIFIDATGSMLLGAGLSYLGFLGFKSPENRFKTVYNPVMDNADYPEEEITTRYHRFVRHFPYFCNMINYCRSKNAESTPLYQPEDDL